MKRFDGEGMSLAEIALELDMTYNQVRRALYSGMCKLRLKTIARELKAEDFYETQRSESRTWQH